MLYPGSNIQFMEVPNGKVPDIQDKADVMVLPVKKGFSASSVPSKLPAYMLSAKPVIACVDFDSDTALCIAEGKCGWTIEPENIEMLVDSLNKAIKMDEKELQEMGQNGFNYAMANFSRKNNFPKLCKVYEDILENS
jgi:glycosyltransferase involved in cell wall biosynthesis